MGIDRVLIQNKTLDFLASPPSIHIDQSLIFMIFNEILYNYVKNSSILVPYSCPDGFSGTPV